MAALRGGELGGTIDLERELAESRAREAAVAEVLKDMSRSDFDLERVLESVTMNAVRLCGADNGSIARLEADGWRIVNPSLRGHRQSTALSGITPLTAFRRGSGEACRRPSPAEEPRSASPRVGARTSARVPAIPDPSREAFPVNVHARFGNLVTILKPFLPPFLVAHSQPLPFRSGSSSIGATAAAGH